jgi:type I restriction enzyme S subunit
MMQGRLQQRATGTTVLGIKQSELRQVEVPLPPLPTQRKIGAIISAYDDLIENNNRRIRLLEELAQRIYREWFVDFRYPGHEYVALVDSECGPLPEGWEWLPASEAVTINPKVAVDRAAIRPFIPMTSLCEDGMHVTAIEQRAGSSGAKFENGDTLFARITPCLENGKTAYVQCLDDGQVASGSTEFIVLRPRRVGPEFTYLLARSEQFRSHALKSMSGATGRQRVRYECFGSLNVPVPSEPVLRSFAALARPLFQFASAVVRTNKSLRAARALLRPRLMSGEVDVTALDIAMPEAAA